MASQDQISKINDRVDELWNRLGRIEERFGLTPPDLRSWDKRLRDWIKKNTAAATIIGLLTLIVTILAIFVTPIFGSWWEHRSDSLNTTIDQRIKSVLAEPGGVQATLTEMQRTANETNTTLKTLQPFIQEVISHQFENVSKLTTQTLIQRIPALENLIAVAKNQNVTVDPKIITAAGTKVVEASRQDAHAWNAALRLVEYKSFNNSVSPFLPDTTNEPEFRDKYVFNSVSGALRPAISLKGKVAADLAAQTGYIGENRNKGVTFGPEWIIFQGGAVGLDRMELRNVVFRNVHISYLGAGPVSMKNVYFINCSFTMPITPVAQHLALALLAPEPSITFSGEPAKHS